MIGRMRESVALQSPGSTRDAYGQMQTNWTTVATVKADVRALRGREFFAAAQVQQEQALKIRIRRRTDVQPTWRLLWDGRSHDITAVIPIGREWTELMVVQGVKDGR
jgi:SPP1 family predicted phage head-tail adaptor